MNRTTSERCRWTSSLALTSALWASTAVAQTQPGDDAASARAAYRHGLELLHAGHYEAAYEAFHASVRASNSPNARLLEARALRELGRFSEAAIEYETAARDAESRATTDTRFANARAAALRELAAIEPRIGRVIVHVAGSSAEVHIQIGGQPVTADVAAAGVPVPPGDASIQVTATGSEPSSLVAHVAAGERSEVSVLLVAMAHDVASSSPRPTPEPEPGPASGSPGAHPTRHVEPGASPEGSGVIVGTPTQSPGPGEAPRRGPSLVPSLVGWTTVVVGAGTLVASAVLFGLTSAEFNRDQGTLCGSDCVSHGESMQLATNATLGVGIGIVVVGVALVLLSIPRRSLQLSGSSALRVVQGEF